MVFKQMKIRKSQNTITGLVVSTLLVMAIFFGAYFYVSENVSNAGLTLDSKYNDSYQELEVARSDVENNTRAIRNNLEGVQEADNTFQVAWNGLKGLGNTLKLPITILNSALITWSSIIYSVDIIPGWAITLVFTGLFAFVVFLVLKVMKGEPNM